MKLFNKIDKIFFNIYNQTLMNISSYHRALSQQIKKGLHFAFTKDTDPEDQQVYFCNDTDNCKYRTIARKHIVSVYFSCTDIDHIWNYNREHLKNRHYPYLNIGIKKIDHQNMLQIIVDDQVLTHAVKQYGKKEQTGVMTGKKKFDTVFQHLSRKLATIKRHFYGSCFQMMLQGAAHNQKSKDTKNVPHFCFNMRPNGHEKIWLVFQRNQFSVFYGLSFDDRSQQQLGKILFQQLMDAKKHVKNSPSVNLMESQFPKAIVQAFPEQKTRKYNFTNGIVSLTLFGNLIRKTQSMATYLAGFRSYAYYHIQASKCYLHSRQLRKINQVQRDLEHAKIEQLVKR